MSNLVYFYEGDKSIYDFKKELFYSLIVYIKSVVVIGPVDLCKNQVI